MKSKRAKGNEFQLWVKDWLEERGWLVRNFPVIARPIMGPGGLPLMRAGRPVFSSMSLDVFGSDLIARRGASLLWIQASLDETVNKRVAEFEKYFSHILPGEWLMLWIKAKPAEIRVKYMVNAPYGRGFTAVELGRIISRVWYPVFGFDFGEMIFRKTKLKESKGEVVA